ncbi:hypothetical protein IFR09_12080 [Pseudomonas syringae]|nr:hypothetical protein [Pseudomonas syringae]MBD8577130.1 hypothetical protein [Pseudomonas syringae]MBD8792797.1 hypothetical protein [Pseudomonas syringae]MBD8803300.1 hypothetical protein [Pseudomonas syringae]MBD8811897.1 hypothetical protein [Pseudomonas syringae]
MNDIAAQRHTSLPYYDVPSGEQRPLQRVLVTQGQGTALAATLQADCTAGLTHLGLPEHRDLVTLQQALAAHLHHSHIGTHLHVQGDEAFLWALRTVAADAGLLSEEITLHLETAAARSVFCVHCAHVQCATDADRHTCCQCAVVLEVRAHFSRRLGAYIGVCADADQPYGEARP